MVKAHKKISSMPSPPKLHRSVNNIKSNICIKLHCNNIYPDNRECMLCDNCTNFFGCKCKLNSKEIFYFTSEPSFEKIQQLVDGYFTIILLENNQKMYINEEGELKKLKINIEASKLVGYTVYGNVLII